VIVDAYGLEAIRDISLVEGMRFVGVGVWST